MSKPKRKYIDVNIPREWEPHLNELLGQEDIQKGLARNGYKNRPSSVGVWIIRQFLIDRTGLRFEHFNTYEDHVTIKDNKLNLYVDIYPKEKGELRCAYCKSANCEHIQDLVNNHPEILKDLEKKGWKYKAT